jgi:hypothetical protein
MNTRSVEGKKAHGGRHRVVTKRASYREAVDWIARNDEPADMDLESIGGYISTQLVMSLFGVREVDVVIDVQRRRAALAEKEKAL